MRNSSLVYRQLTPGLQQRLAQLALLQQRATVLARLPAVTLSKGKPVRWAGVPAPLLLRQVMVLAALDGEHRLSALLLRNWFQHKVELCGLVRRALQSQNYLVPPLGVLPQPAAAVRRLSPRDLGPAPANDLFYPAGAPLPGTAASPEEGTLMAELLGWCARRPGPDELAADNRGNYLRTAYQALGYFEDLLADLLDTAPASPAGQLAARGELPAIVDAATETALNWTERYELYRALRDALHKLTGQPEPGLDAPIYRTELEGLVERVEAIDRSEGFREDTQHWMLDALAQVERVRHKQQPDFTPLAAVHAQARALAERAAAGDDLGALIMEHVMPLMALLDWIRVPGRLDQLDPQSEELRQLEAAVPPAVFNALLLHKLTVAEDGDD